MPPESPRPGAPRRLPIGVRTVGADERLSIVDHLDELRRRIIICIVALAVAFVATYVLRDPLVRALKHPLPHGSDSALITLGPAEPFFIIMKVCAGCALLLALPVWLYQAYAFVIPAVTEQSRRVMLTVVAGVASLFLAGVAFGYFVVLPVALKFLINFGDGLFVSQLQAGPYFSFVTAMLLASGLMFELPVAMLAFARLGVVTAEMYVKQWRIAIVVIAAVAAALPGGDPFSMFLLMLPQIVLYALGVWLARAFAGPPIWDRQAWAGVRGDDADADGPDEPHPAG